MEERRFEIGVILLNKNIEHVSEDVRRGDKFPITQFNSISSNRRDSTSTKLLTHSVLCHWLVYVCVSYWVSEWIRQVHSRNMCENWLSHSKTWIYSSKSSVRSKKDEEDATQRGDACPFTARCLVNFFTQPSGKMLMFDTFVPHTKSLFCAIANLFSNEILEWKQLNEISLAIQFMLLLRQWNNEGDSEWLRKERYGGWWSEGLRVRLDEIIGTTLVKLECGWYSIHSLKLPYFQASVDSSKLASCIFRLLKGLSGDFCSKRQWRRLDEATNPQWVRLRFESCRVESSCLVSDRPFNCCHQFHWWVFLTCHDLNIISLYCDNLSRGFSLRKIGIMRSWYKLPTKESKANERRGKLFNNSVTTNYHFTMHSF